MIDISLQTFITTGHFGPLHTGMSQEAMESILGAAEITGYHLDKNGPPFIWRYGDIEFHFGVTETDELWLIHMELDLSPLDGEDYFRIDPWIIRPGMVFAECEDELRKYGVSYRSSTLDPGFGAVIRVGKTVEVRFEEREDAPGPLVLFALSSCSFFHPYPGEKVEQ